MPMMGLPDMDEADVRSALGMGAFRPTALRSRLEMLRDKQERLIQDLLQMEQEAAALERLLEG